MLAPVVSAHSHPTADRLARFLRGDLSGEENRAVVTRR
jgi:hypothetical protein